MSILTLGLVRLGVYQSSLHHRAHDGEPQIFLCPGKESGCYQKVSHAKVQKLRCYLAIALVRPAPPAPGGSG